MIKYITRFKNLPLFVYSFSFIFVDFIVYFSVFFATLFVLAGLYPSSLQHAVVFSFINILVSLYIRAYKVVWGFFGIHDAKQILKGLLISHLIFVIIFNTEYALNFYFFLLLVAAQSIITLRLFYANWRTLFLKQKPKENIIIIGAGDAGEQLYRELKKSEIFKLNPLGFLDDFSSRKNVKIHGAPVFGRIDDMAQVKERLSISKAVVAIPSASTEQLQRIYSIAKEAHVELRTLPPLSEILNNKVTPFQIKDISPEDLLGRNNVKLDGNLISEILNNKVILITGAGGSIGSEICKQVIQYSPKKIILFEQSEFSLYEIELHLRDFNSKIEIVPVLGDIRNPARVDAVFAKYMPNVIFHAAAYKHVPMVEYNPLEAVRTNVIGTLNLARAAGESGAERFTLISTDKAVNPTNIMGATKRVAEIACQVYANKFPNTNYMAVRFGNVLGSNGSVIPLFKKQIISGGPVTVTHRDITRYFMSIPEASQLVINASIIGKGGEIFVLDMGKPIKIYDLAQRMIRLNGFEPGSDMEIEITGLRPGEKLFEELFDKDEHLIETTIDKIKIAKMRLINPNAIQILNDLKLLEESSSKAEVISALQKLVPEFTHQENA